MNLMLIGPPGSGKGTQGELLSRRFRLEHIAAGDRLRDEVEQETPVGKSVADHLRRGELVPDEVIVELLMPVIVMAAADNGYVLDGFPRSVGQAKIAREMADQAGAVPGAVIYLDASREELIRRILERANIEGRSDDTAAVVENRLEVFDEATLPLVDYYRNRGLLHTIDANQSEDRVQQQILDAIGALAPDPQ